MMASEAPEPEIARSPLMGLFTKLEQLTEDAQTQQAFRNGEFVLFVIRHLLDKYSIGNPTTPVTVAEQLSSFADKFTSLKSKATEKVAETTEEAISSLPIPLSGFAARKICGRVFEKSDVGDTKTLMDRVAALTTMIGEAAISLDDITLSALKEFIGEEMKSFIFPTYSRYMDQKNFTTFISDFVGTINTDIVMKLYHEYKNRSPDDSEVVVIRGHNLNEIINKGIKEVRVLNTLDRYITEIFRFLTSISKINRSHHAVHSEALLNTLKGVIEGTYTGMTLTDESIAEAQAMLAKSSQSTTVIKKKAAKAKKETGKQVKKKSTVASATKSIAKAVTHAESRAVDFSILLELPESIIDYDFDMESYVAVIDAYCEVCDARELLRVLIDASTTLIFEEEYTGRISVTNEDIDENQSISTTKLVSQTLIAKIMPCMNRVSMKFYEDPTDLGVGATPIYQALTSIPDSIEIGDTTLRIFSHSVQGQGNHFATITYRDPNEEEHTLLLSKEYEEFLINTAPPGTGIHVPLILRELTRFKNPNNLVGYHNGKNVQCIVEPLMGTLTMTDHANEEAIQVRLRLLPPGSDKVTQGKAQLSDDGPEPKLTIYRKVKNKTMDLSRGLCPGLLDDRLSSIFEGTMPYVSHIHPFILASIYRGIGEGDDILKVCVLTYLNKISESEANARLKDQGVQEVLARYLGYLQDEMVEYYFLKKQQTQTQTQEAQEAREAQEAQKRIENFLSAIPHKVVTLEIQHVPEIQALMTYLNAYDPQNPKYSIIANCYLLLKSLVVIVPGEEVKTRMSKVEGAMLDFFFKEG